jgi:hypothetical protein
VLSAGFVLLLLVNFSRSLNRVRILGRFVGSYSYDSREAKGVAAFVAVGAHHVVECHFQDYLWLDYKPESLIFNRVLEKPFGHLGDLGVGQA